MEDKHGHVQPPERERLSPADVPPLLAGDDLPAQGPPSEFVCPGCGRPLHITLRSDMCFAEAQVYCPDCERDYQERRGRWAPGAEES